MYLSELRIWNFRKFGTKKLANGIEGPGLSLRFNEGLNLLVGENDSGKTAIVDAIKLIILTQSREYIRLEYEDFHIPPELHGENERSNWLRIECIFRGFENEEAKNFLEWLGIEKGDSGKEEYFLRAFLNADRKGRKVPAYNVKAGPDEEGLFLEGEARDLLRALYLKPLRDAESELIPGRRSRLAQILNSHDLWEINEDSKLEITGSKRFSSAIAAVIKYICVRPHDRHPLTGNPEVQDIRPIIIAFEDKHIEKVIDRFGDLIFDNQLHLQRDPRFKAVGWRGRPHPSEHSIHSYWQGYRKEVQTKRVEYSTLASYIQPQSEGVIGQRTVNYYRKAIILALLKCLRIAGRPITTPLLSERSLFTYLSRENQAFHDKLKLNLAQWCLAIHRKESVLKDLIQYIGVEFSDFFDIRGSTELEQFLTGTALPLPQDVPEPSNIYLHPQYGEQIKIEVCTIHAAKGQTHTATLYLETFFYQYDIGRIIAYLKGNHTLPTQKLVRTNLRMAYVGMSRPSHLLCVAVHNANISDHLDKLREAGWEIDTTLVD